MSSWNKKNLTKEMVQELNQKYGCDALTASILWRRSITEGNDILFYLEDDLRYLHNPFLFTEMEDAVDRINNAIEEKENVLIFGDRDVDGITSTSILYRYFKERGLEVKCRLPEGDEAYGLSKDIIDNFAKDFGSLIITVDCGISCEKEISYATECGIDVIVTDHHTPPEMLPENAIIINPKVDGEEYPFKDICGCEVVYKLISALRFSQCSMYKQEICLMNVRPLNDSFQIECLKIRNMAEKSKLIENIVPGVVSITQTRLVPFLKGQQIFVFDINVQKKMLSNIFGSGIDFQLMDIRPEIAKIIPSIANISLLRLKDMSRIAKYKDEPSSELDGFFNIFITYIQLGIASLNEKAKSNQEQELQLTSLAVLADIMPLKNENRIIVKKGIQSMQGKNLNPALKELLARQHLLGKHISSSDLAWNVTPALNATGRLGQPELALKFFTTDDPKEREILADKIIKMNEERKQLGQDAYTFAEPIAYKSLEQYSNNLVFVFDERINRGVTGIVATKLAKLFKVPAITLTCIDGTRIVGSFRSVRGFILTDLLQACSDLFISFGGHAFAAGFSLEKENLTKLEDRLKKLSTSIQLESLAESETINIDAELPASYLKPDILNLIDKFEPYGEKNDQLIFLMSKVKLINAEIIGKSTASHLRLSLSIMNTIWPAVFWNAAEKYKRDFDNGDILDIVFKISRNTFNGMENIQLSIIDVKKT